MNELERYKYSYIFSRLKHITPSFLSWHKHQAQLFYWKMIWW